MAIELTITAGSGMGLAKITVDPALRPSQRIRHGPVRVDRGQLQAPAHEHSYVEGFGSCWGYPGEQGSTVPGGKWVWSTWQPSCGKWSESWPHR